MRTLTDELLERIAENYDPDYLVDVLQIESRELLEAFPSHLAEALERGDILSFSEEEE